MQTAKWKRHFSVVQGGPAGVAVVAVVEVVVDVVVAAVVQEVAAATRQTIAKTLATN